MKSPARYELITEINLGLDLTVRLIRQFQNEQRFCVQEIYIEQQDGCDGTGARRWIDIKTENYPALCLRLADILDDVVKEQKKKG